MDYFTRKIKGQPEKRGQALEIYPLKSPREKTKIRQIASKREDFLFTKSLNIHDEYRRGLS